MLENQKSKGCLFIISGPAGSGKTTLCDGLIHQEKIQRIITTTTRLPRNGEVDGVDYHFLDRASFEQKIQEGAFYEYATVHNNYYGTERSALVEPILGGHNLLLNIDVQGAKTISEKAAQDAVLKGQVITLFVEPPSVSELEARLKNRGTDSADEIKRRLEVAREEILQKIHYDHVIISQTKEIDFNKVRSIYYAEIEKTN